MHQFHRVWVASSTKNRSSVSITQSISLNLFFLNFPAPGIRLFQFLPIEKKLFVIHLMISFWCWKYKLALNDSDNSSGFLSSQFYLSGTLDLGVRFSSRTNSPPPKCLFFHTIKVALNWIRNFPSQNIWNDYFHFFSVSAFQHF